MSSSLLTVRVSPVKNDSLFKRFVSPGDRHRTETTIEGLLTSINNAASYRDVPDKVLFVYDFLEKRNFNLKDLTEVINITNRLSANKFGVSPKNIQFTGAASKPISDNFLNDLKDSGFEGSTLTALTYGMETALDAHHEWCNDNSIWHVETYTPATIIKPHSTPLGIELTFRQQQVLHLVKNRGLTNKKIAKELSISEQAVKQHLTIILKKFGVQNRTQLLLVTASGLRQ